MLAIIIFVSEIYILGFVALVKNVAYTEQEVKARSPSLSSSSVEISAESSVEIDSDLSISISDRNLQRSIKTRSSSLRHSEKTRPLPKDKTPSEAPQTASQESSDYSSHSSATHR